MLHFFSAVTNIILGLSFVMFQGVVMKVKILGFVFLFCGFCTIFSMDGREEDLLRQGRLLRLVFVKKGCPLSQRSGGNPNQEPREVRARAKREARLKELTEARINAAKNIARNQEVIKRAAQNFAENEKAIAVRKDNNLWDEMTREDPNEGEDTLKQSRSTDKWVYVQYKEGP